MSVKKYTYDDIKTIVSNNGGLNNDQNNDQPPLESQTLTGTATIDLGPYQDAALAIKFDEETDQTYDITVSATAADPSVASLLAINHTNINTYIPDATGGSIFLDSDRIVINAKENFAMLFGQKGVAIASPNQVNIDAGKTITLFGRSEVFIGLPNRGGKVSEDKKRSAPATSRRGTGLGDPTPDELYEPLLLGLKVVNFLEDLISSIQNIEIAGPLGTALLQPSSAARLELLKTRLPEIMSNYAYVDGISHEEVDVDRLKVVAAAAAATQDFVPPRQLIGTVVVNTNVDPANPPPPPNPVTSPFKDIPGYYNTPPSPLYGDPI